MTLKDFLALAGVVRKEDVVTMGGSVFGVDPVGLWIENQVLGFGNEVKEGGDLGKGWEGRKRSAMDLVDRAALQRQKRMIKNWESEAYTLELETLLTQLEEENVRLLKELNAMAYVFGSTFVCQYTDAAKEVSFTCNINTASVTLERDIFQPSGLLTGGSQLFMS